jgi:hypothetical protein
LTPSMPARSSSNSASGAHSAVANVSLTAGSPPQATEFSSVRRNGSPAPWASRTAGAPAPCPRWHARSAAEEWWDRYAEIPGRDSPPPVPRAEHPARTWGVHARRSRRRRVVPRRELGRQQ